MELGQGWVLGEGSAPRAWRGTGTGSPGTRSWQQACQSSIIVWTVLSEIWFDFGWSCVEPEVGLNGSFWIPSHSGYSVIHNAGFSVLSPSLGMSLSVKSMNCVGFAVRIGTVDLLTQKCCANFLRVVVWLTQQVFAEEQQHSRGSRSLSKTRKSLSSSKHLSSLLSFLHFFLHEVFL